MFACTISYMSAGQRSGKSSILSLIVGLLWCAPWIWGTGWTFYRHGAGDGLLALLIPPYACYRGLASIWEEPKWKKDWDVSVQGLGFLVQSAAGQMPPSQELELIKGKALFKKWVASLPVSQRKRLFSEADAFSSALNQVRRNLIEDAHKSIMNGETSIHFRSMADAAVVASSMKFADEPGFTAAWRRVEEEQKLGQRTFEAAFASMQENFIRSGTNSDLKSGEVSAVFRRAGSDLTDGEAKTVATLAELFGPLSSTR